MKIVVDVRWDDEADVWYAVARGKIGLATEHASLDGLRERMVAVLPDLLDLKHGKNIDLEMIVRFPSPAPIAAE